jgi:hypothetical protein
VVTESDTGTNSGPEEAGPDELADRLILDELAETVADLDARLSGLETKISHLDSSVVELQDTIGDLEDDDFDDPGAWETSDPDGPQAAPADGRTGETGPAMQPPASQPSAPATGDPADVDQKTVPTFILHLKAGSPAEDAELDQLIKWVHDLLVPSYVTTVSSTRTWCTRWWEHPTARARLHALWLAWQELTIPAAGHTGPSVWHRDHLDPAMGELRSPDGPFRRCMLDVEHPEHALGPSTPINSRNPAS